MGNKFVGRRRAMARGEWEQLRAAAVAGVEVWGFMFICTNLLFRGPVAVGDTGLYYVLCDEGCLTADNAELLREDGVMEWWSTSVHSMVKLRSRRGLL